MTIVYCTAISRGEAEAVLRGFVRHRRLPVDCGAPAAWLGIEPHESPLRRFPQQRQLLVEFDDVTDPADDAASARWFSSTTSPHTPSLADARQIVAFVHALHTDARPWALLVHCTAGVSRSTATALWVREHCGVTAPPLPEGMVGRFSSPWRPNKTLARLLREAAAEVTT